jgi:hypothetical protein
MRIIVSYMQLKEGIEAVSQDALLDETSAKVISKVLGKEKIDKRL